MAISQDKYTIPDPFCNGNVTIVHVMEGVWTMHPDDSNCETCINFVIRVAPVFDTLSDHDIINIINAMEGKSVIDD